MPVDDHLNPIQRTLTAIKTTNSPVISKSEMSWPSNLVARWRAGTTAWLSSALGVLHAAVVVF